MILGLIQGLTEFIPVSSSGHLILVGELFNFSASSFEVDALLNIGTLLALVLYFRQDLLEIAKDVLFQKNYHLAINIIIAIIPAVLVGIFLQPLIETVFRSTMLVAIMLIGIGLIMLAVDRFVLKGGDLDKLTSRKSLLIGIAQVIAFLPGSSRSAVTIIGGRLAGLNHESAARFSFLLAIPLFSGALLKVLMDSETTVLLAQDGGPVIAGIIVACVAGVAAIHFMLSYLRSHKLAVFAYYRIIIGLVVLLTVVNS